MIFYTANSDTGMFFVLIPFTYENLLCEYFVHLGQATKDFNVKYRKMNFTADYFFFGEDLSDQ